MPSVLKGPKKLLIVLILLLAIFVLLLPPLYKLRNKVSDANGLVLIAAASCDEEGSALNPHYWIIKKLIGPSAMLILLNTEYPYSEEHEQAPDLIPGLVNLMTTSPCMNEERTGHALLYHFIRIGEPINNYYSGWTALMSSLIYDPDVKLVKMLLEAGADPYLTIQNKLSKSHGMNVFEMVEQKMSQFPDQYEVIHDLLQSYKI